MNPTSTHPLSSARTSRSIRPCVYQCGANVSGSRHACKGCQKRASDFAQALVYAAGRPSFALAAYDTLGDGARKARWSPKTGELRGLLIRLANYVRANGAEDNGPALAASAGLGDADAAIMASRLQTSLRRALRFPRFERALESAVTAKLPVPRTAHGFLFGAASRGVLRGAA